MAYWDSDYSNFVCKTWMSTFSCLILLWSCCISKLTLSCSNPKSNVLVQNLTSISNCDENIQLILHSYRIRYMLHVLKMPNRINNNLELQQGNKYQIVGSLNHDLSSQLQILQFKLQHCLLVLCTWWRRQGIMISLFMINIHLQARQMSSKRVRTNK